MSVSKPQSDPMKRKAIDLLTAVTAIKRDDSKPAGEQYSPVMLTEEAQKALMDDLLAALPEKNEIPVKIYQEAKDLIRAGKSGQAIIMVHDAVVDQMEQAIRSYFGEKL